MAVVESELEMLSDAMEQVAKRYHSGRKILKLIETHLDSIKMVVYRNGTLRAGFFRNIWRVEAVRKTLIQKKSNFSNKYWRKEKTRVFLILIM